MAIRNAARADARAEALAGLMPLAEWAGAMGISVFTANKWRRQWGLPIIKRGKLLFVDVAKARAWLAKGERTGPQRRRVAE